MPQVSEVPRNILRAGGSISVNASGGGGDAVTITGVAGKTIKIYGWMFMASSTSGGVTTVSFTTDAGTLLALGGAGVHPSIMPVGNHLLVEGTAGDDVQVAMTAGPTSGTGYAAVWYEIS